MATDQELHRRRMLASERTFAAWLRTGLAVIVVGLAVVRFLADEHGPLHAGFVGVGIGYVLVGLSLYGFAAYDFFQSRKGVVAHRYHALVAIASAIAALSFILLILLLLDVTRA